MLRAERLPRPRLERLQAALVAKLVRHAFRHVPAYRDLWRAQGITADDLADPDILGRLPVIDKDAIRDLGSERFIDERLGGTAKLLARHTSGSSGKPFEFYVDAAYNRWRKAQRLRPYVSNGLEPWHRTVVLTYRESSRPGLLERLYPYAARYVRVTRPPRELFEMLVAGRPHAVSGYPSALGLVAAEIQAVGGLPRPPRLVFTDSELLSAAARARLRAAFGSDPIDVYGTIESDNTAFQCSERGGLHVAMESVAVEIVAGSARVPDGADGEIVVTVLRNYAMPFIRYNLHDVAAYANVPCRCGRTLPTLARVLGRDDDYLRLAGGRRGPVNPLLAEIDRLSAWIREFRIVQHGVGRFAVYLRATGDLGEAERRMAAVLQRYVPGAQASFVACPAGVPRDPSGKLRAFVWAPRD